MIQDSGKLFVVSGPSGTGKTTLCRQLEAELGLFFSISATTRPIRVGEIEGHGARIYVHIESATKWPSFF